MDIMSKIICPYCQEWLDIESFITLDDLKNEFAYKECYLCNKRFALFLNTTIKANPYTIEIYIEDKIRTIKFYKEILEENPTSPTNTLIKSLKYHEAELETLYKLQKENEKK